jgi:hypothetical protein
MWPSFVVSTGTRAASAALTSATFPSIAPVKRRAVAGSSVGESADGAADCWGVCCPSTVGAVVVNSRKARAAVSRPGVGTVKAV